MTGKCLANQTVPRGNHMPKDISCNEPYSGNTADPHIFALTLWDIASWQITDKTLSEQKASFRPESLKGQTGIHAGLPTLQRGAVWRARQIELFWDSLLRSFPVGSLLLAKKITGQDTRPSPVTGSAPEASYHILDGQQRSNAIAWGFYLPEQPEKNGKGKYTFPPTEDTAGKNKAAKSMLWLDLCRSMIAVRKAPPRTSRKYLFRLTTTAHPWGYPVDDNAYRLPYHDIENFRKTYDKVVSSSNEGSGNKTYHVHASVPQKAVMPIPMGLLMKYAKNSTNGLSIDWTELLRNPWIAFIDDWLTCRNEINKDSSVTLSKWLDEVHQEKIIKWLSPLPHIIIPAINCSTIFFGKTDENNVDNAALIFERINNQGSPINQEELQYSLIKAYFPAVEETINHIEEKQKGLPTGEARLVRLGVRAALLTVKPANDPGREILPYKEKQLFTHIETKTIRSWFTDKDKEQNVISAYFNKNDASNDCLFKAIEWIENQLVYRHNGKKKPYTLHPYLRSSIAWSSPDVYLWWMLLAEAFNYGELDDSKKKRILAISTVIHWFGYKKSDLVNDLIKEIRRKQNDNTPVEIDAFKLPQPGTDNNLMAFPAPPDTLLDALGKGLNARFREASEGKSPLRAYNPAFFLTDERAQSYRDIVSILSQKTELLVYVQREYLAELAVGYDPSQRSLWENHNRPWDYDHIVPSDFFNGTGSSKSDFIKAYYVCKCLQQSIGNQMALSFSENRSKKDKPPSSLSDEEYWSRAFCYTNKSPDELKTLKAGFTCEKNDFRTSPKNSGNAANDKAKAFAEAALNRMIGIYRKWYDDLGVRDIFDTSPGS